MENLASVLENDTYKFLCDFGIHKDHLISAKPNNNQQPKKKRIFKIVDFAVLSDHIIKLKESEKKNTYLDLC